MTLMIAELDRPTGLLHEAILQLQLALRHTYTRQA